MLNEFTYCPRLCYMEWVQGEFAHSADTVDGRLPAQADGIGRPASCRRRASEWRVARGVEDEEGQSERLHAAFGPAFRRRAGREIARIDLVEAEGGPRHAASTTSAGPCPTFQAMYNDPERVQLCLQGLLLRANGYACEQGVIYYVGSKRRVHVGV